MGQHEKLVILGTGPAGLTAAIYSARAGLRPLCIEGEQPGGQLTITSEVENYPGFAEPVMGPDLMDAFKKQAERFETRFQVGRVVKVKFDERPFRLELDDGNIVTTEALIISTGASAQWLGLESEKRLMGKGVSACATCDGFFFKGKKIVVVGGGDTALEEATFLTRFASHVTVVHRRDQLRASQAMQQKAFKNPKIDFVWDSAIEEILGENEVVGVRIKNVKTQAVSKMDIDGVFIAIGHTPNTAVFKPYLECDPKGYLVTAQRASTKTNIEGIFAAGDVADSVYRQAVTAAGLGCMAAMESEKYLESIEASK